MSPWIVSVTLVLYMGALVAVGLWASRRTQDQSDFFLGGRGLGPFVAALSYSASAASAWTLLGLSGVAWVLGVSALWIAAGATVTMLVAWFWIAPRLMHWTRDRDQLTLTDFLVDDAKGAMRSVLVALISVIVLVSFTMYVAAQFQGAGQTFASTFGWSIGGSIAVGAIIILVYTLLGGFWAVSVTDSIQGALMALTAVLLPIAALVAVGGPAGFIEGLAAVSSPAQLSFSGGRAGLIGLGVIIGSLAIGIGTFGQPQLLVRFMALRNDRARRQAAWLTTAWYALVFFGMVFVGLAGRILHPELANPETLFFTLTETLFHPVFGAILLAAVLSAIMSTADSQLVVSASVVSHDLGLARRLPARQMLVTRLSVAGVVVAAVLVAVHLPAQIFDRVLASWIALGSAFGPLIFWRLAGKRTSAVVAIASILTGYGLAIALPLTVTTPGLIIERLVPFTLAFAVLLINVHRKPDANR
ncbi:MAG: sodium/proline symporter [Wenzhouxiangella sp.]|nr:sodium/proline symporter [Wenzhouxiangella sp.]